MLPCVLEVDLLQPYLAQHKDLLTYGCSNSRPAGSTPSPTHTPWELLPLHITFSRLSHITLKS